MDLILPVTKPGGITFKDNKGFYLALVRGFLPAVFDVLQTVSRSHQQHRPSIFWLFACPVPEFLSAHFSPVSCNLEKLLFFVGFSFCQFLPCFSRQFHLTRSTSGIAAENMHLGNSFMEKCLSDLIYIVACPLKLD